MYENLVATIVIGVLYSWECVAIYLTLGIVTNRKRIQLHIVILTNTVCGIIKIIKKDPLLM